MDIANLLPGGDVSTAETLSLLPVSEMVLMPGLVQPMTVENPTAGAALQEAARTGQHVVVVLARRPPHDVPALDDLHPIGTEARLLRYFTGRDGTHHAILLGIGRVKLINIIQEAGQPAARVERIAEPSAGDAGIDAGIDARMHRLRERGAEILRLVEQAPPELTTTLRSIDQAGALADFITGVLDITPAEKQEILETIELEPRLDKVLERAGYRLEVLKLSRDIGLQTRASMEGRQREFLLREQLKAIQKELGESDDTPPEIEELKARLDTADMPDTVTTLARRELRRLERMPEASTETGMIRSYLEWLTELPWRIAEGLPIDIAEARRVLDADHFGLAKIKRRILEFLAVRKLNPDGKAPILCFVGPPGVGKTSLGQSIARAIGRTFVRISLGGVHDEAEIRGHRRTYVGAMPGNIIQAIRRAGARDGVMMLDEIDKLGGGGFQGDPASALLEVLDPEQNATFRDAYLGVPFDVSKIIFIATANALDTIAGPLRDRMEIVHLSGYTAEEKVEIARRHLIPRQMAQNGLADGSVTLDDAALNLIIDGYTREAGVRNLEREIGAVLRSIAVGVAEAHTEHVAIDVDAVAAILGTRQHDADVAQQASIAGVATGLAWTPVGGDILFIEASLIPGTGKLILTGQLGDVMKESAQAALSLLKTRAAVIGIDAERFVSNDIHVHVPAGATPKDGPSAGVAMFVAMSSLLTGRPVPPTTAMTGEISLRGLVLPVGGIREKVIAAARAGIDTVLLPARNRRDFEEIPQSARDRLRFFWLDSVDDALAATIAEAGRVAKPIDVAGD